METEVSANLDCLENIWVSNYAIYLNFDYMSQFFLKSVKKCNFYQLIISFTHICDHDSIQLSLMKCVSESPIGILLSNDTNKGKGHIKLNSSSG